LPELRIELMRSPEAAAACKAVSEETGKREEAMMADNWVGLARLRVIRVMGW
jgi:hypothetical protein